MPDRLDVAVVGAGPFGLSVAAWLTGRRTRVFGTPFRTWRTAMPPDMLLRSAWDETSLSAAGGRGSLDEFAAATGTARTEPIPVELFVGYGDWFRERYVGEADPADVVGVERAGGAFAVHTAAGETFTAATVVAAVGAIPFAAAPPELAAALGTDVTFATAHTSFERFRRARVVVVGAGQAGLEAAALAAAAGADVEVLARSGVRWFADREPHHERGRLGRALYRLAYPVVGYGPPPLNRAVRHPDAFSMLPRPVRDRLSRRILRPGGSPWIRAAVDGRVRVTHGAVAAGIERMDGAIRLRLRDGGTRDADHVLLATGYRFGLDRLEWLDDEIRRHIRTSHGWPVLDRAFRSTVPGLRFVGYAAEGRFGPSARFVLGAGFAARRIAETI